MNTRMGRAGSIALLMLALPTFAQAALIVVAGNDNTLVDNVVHNPCSASLSGQGTTIQGCLNSDHSVVVDFTSNEILKYGNGGGQASIEAVDGAFDNLLIQISNPAGSVFQKLILNIDAKEDSTVTFTGVPGGAFGPLALDKNGQNYFTVYDTTGGSFSSISFLTSAGINGVQLVSDVKQVRIGGITDPACVGPDCPVINPVIAPEPATLVLLGMGLLGTGVMRRRRK